MFDVFPKLGVYQEPEAQGLPLPKYGYAGDVGLDVPTSVEVTIPPHSGADVQTSIRLHIPKGHYVHVYAKGSSARRGIGFDLSIVDQGYTGVLTLFAWNHSGEPVTVPRGKCIAQLVLRKYEQANVKALNIMEIAAVKTERGGGRMNSTGTGLD